jgi:type I restriction enzyme S subunit
MMWTVRTLGEVCDEVDGIIQTGPFGSQLHESDYVTDGVPIVMPKNILGGRVSTEDIALISENDAKRLERHAFALGDIVYGRRGDIGRRALVTERERGWLCGTGCLRISLGDTVVDPRYLYYYLGEPSVINLIANQAIGATLPNLNTDILRNVPVRYPLLHIQHRIASILSSYDDLVANNTRRIKILEEMAQMIYREWFVNFRFPGHDRVTNVKSRGEAIPNGWAMRKLADIAGVNERSIKPGNTIEEICYIDITSVSTARIHNKVKMHLSDAPGRARRVVRHGDIIWSTVRPNRKSFALILQPEANLIVSTGFAVLTAREVPYTFLYFATTTEDFSKYLTNHARGSAYPAVASSDFENAEILCPPKDLLDQFHSITTDMMDLQHCLHLQNMNLITTRDFLLPKLISGEIRVEHFEAEAAAQTA